MKVLSLSPYIYYPAEKAFSKNSSGFGMMTYSILDAVSGKGANVFCLTHAITQGKQISGITFIKHTFPDIFKSIHFCDFIRHAVRILERNAPARKKLRWLYYSLDAGFVEKKIRQIQPDIVHIHGLGTSTENYVAVCQKLKIQYAVTLHGTIENDPTATPYDREIERTCLQYFDREHIPVSVVSTGVKQRLQEKPYYGLKCSSNIEVIPNGIDVTQRSPQSNIREQYQIGANSKIMLSVGSICNVKNQIQLIRAINLLPEDVQKNLWFFLIGTVSPGYPIWEEVEKLKYKEQVVITGFLPHEQLPDYFCEADLVVMASTDEGFGLSLVEGFAYGVPSLTFADLNAVFDIYDETSMLLCHERSDEALSAAMAQALEATWDHDAIRRHARNFSLDAMADRYLTWYQSIVKE